MHDTVLVPQAGPAALAHALRRHWTLGNGVHRVRDVTWREDRSHARRIGRPLATLRNTVMTLVRGLGYTFIPDGWRALGARPDYGLPYLIQPLEQCKALCGDPNPWILE